MLDLGSRNVWNWRDFLLYEAAHIHLQNICLGLNQYGGILSAGSWASSGSFLYRFYIQPSILKYENTTTLAILGFDNKQNL